MELEDIWKSYVGERSPAEFMQEHGDSRDAYAAAERYVAQLPHIYGVVLRESWDRTFTASTQMNRHQVAVRIAAYLDEHREEWADDAAETAPRGTKFYEDPLAALNEPFELQLAPQARAQNTEIDQSRPFQEQPLPKSRWVDVEESKKYLVNVPTDQEVETRRQREQQHAEQEEQQEQKPAVMPAAYDVPLDDILPPKSRTEKAPVEAEAPESTAGEEGGEEPGQQ